MRAFLREPHSVRDVEVKNIQGTVGEQMTLELDTNNDGSFTDCIFTITSNCLQSRNDQPSISLGPAPPSVVGKVTPYTASIVRLTSSHNILQDYSHKPCPFTVAWTKCIDLPDDSKESSLDPLVRKEHDYECNKDILLFSIPVSSFRFRYLIPIFRF